MQADLNLAADSLDRFAVEARLAQRQPQQVESGVAILGQGPERPVEPVHAAFEREPDRQVFQLGLEGPRVEFAGALVEQTGEHVG